MLAFLLLACVEDGPASDGSLEGGSLFPVADGDYAAYRYLGATDYTEAGLDYLDESDLLHARTATGGCDGAGWRFELRRGGSWESADGVGALHFSDADGLSICGWEDEDGVLEPLATPIVLWTESAGVVLEEAVVSGEFSSTATQIEDLGTYFGTFPRAVVFTLAGSGALDGWMLTLAESYGVVMIRNGDFAADLVFRR